MVSYQRQKKILVRRGIPREQVDKCKSNAELDKLLIKFNKSEEKKDVISE